MSPRRRRVPTVAACLLALSLVPVAHAGPVPERDTRSAGAAAVTGAPAARLPGRPVDDVVRDVPVDPTDASIPLGVVPYHDFAPRLRALQASERVSVEVIGTSALGRDLHMVVVTSPTTDEEWARWQRLSDLRTEDPVAAAATLAAGGYDGWRTPLFVNGNIHGNEWEGTDAAFRVLDELAFSDDADVARLVDEHVVAFVVSMNPDGRVAGTRGNGNGFDMNRDLVTQSQAEDRALRDQLVRYEPLTVLDLHGYVGRTLIEPATGPHGADYEYDLYIRNALRNGLAMEEKVVADNADDLAPYYGGSYTSAVIPYRDHADGWDDWPPVFTPMYAMLHGAVGHTVEVPLNPRGATLTQAERLDRTRINTNVGVSAIEADLAWANENAEGLLADQIELFRRGEAGEPSRPVDDPLALDLGRDPATGVDNTATLPQDYPRAYVVPVGDDQRSETAAARVVRFLLDNDVEVRRATAPVRVGGTAYPAGSYVVDMHQAKRGMADAVLDVGEDVTELFPTMYDISAWSLASLWGADVDVVQEGTLPETRLAAVTAPAPTGSVPTGRRPAYLLDVDSLEGVQAVNRLLAEGVTVSRAADGRFVVEAPYAVVRAVATDLGVDLLAAVPGRVRAAAPVRTVRVAAAAAAEEVFALRSMGFDVTPVTTAGFDTGTYAFSDFDALYVESANGLDPTLLTGAAATGLTQFLAGGGTVVGQGAGGVSFNARAALLPVAATAARSDANGIVAVTNDPASPLTGGALEESFVSSPRFFSTVGAGVRVDQRLAGGDFLLAGHWTGQEAAAGQPVVVSGVSPQGAEVALFATEPLYRSHPQGLFPQVAAALWGGTA